MDGLLGESAVLTVNGDFDDNGDGDDDADDRVEIPLSGERGDRFSSPLQAPGCQEYLVLT